MLENMSALSRVRKTVRHLCPEVVSSGPTVGSTATKGRGRLLDGVRVVELATVVAAPSACALLADYGADVIKIENPGAPDITRGWGAGDDVKQTADAELRQSLPRNSGGGSAFVQYNRGKRCIVLDPTKKQGYEVLLRLLATADIFVTNVRSKSLKKAGLDYDTLQKQFPRLIYGHLTAFGRSGPMVDDAGYDFGAFWAYSGLMDAARPREDGDMPRFPGAIGDNTTGFQLVGGILGALYHREKTGEGQLVDASLMRAGIYGLAQLISQYSGGNNWATKPGGHPDIPAGGLRETTALGERRTAITDAPYRCKDGVWIYLTGLEFKRHIPNLLAALGVSGEAVFGGKPKADRDTDWAAATRAVDALIGTRTSGEWEPIFKKHDVWYKRINRFNEVLDDEQVNAVGTFVYAPGVKHKLLGSPILFSGTEAHTPVKGGAQYGEHTDEVLLSELGCTEDDLREMERAGVVARRSKRVTT